MWHFYTLEYFSAFKKNNDILKFACKWMRLEETILSEVTQTKKYEHGMYLLRSGYTCKAKDIENIVHDPREAK